MGDEMIESGQSCYRVSLLSGSLEVSARLKNADDLEILMRVLEANKVIFSREDRPNSEAVVTSPELTKVDRKKQKIAKAKRFNGEFTDESETEVLTLA
jgi:hypothetical protein